MIEKQGWKESSSLGANQALLVLLVYIGESLGTSSGV